MIEKLYPTSIEVSNDEFTRRIREKFSTVSEFECAAHAALPAGPIDYFIYLDGQCYLGDIPVGSTASSETTLHTIRIVRGIVIFYMEILMEKNYLWCFFMSEKIHNSTFQAKISV